MSEIETLEVRLGDRSYPIVVGEALLARADEWLVSRLSSPRVIIVTDRQVGPRYAKQLSHALQPHGIRVDVIEIEAGEGSKSFSGLEALMNKLLALQPDRKTTILALGGGVVGDLTGFAASILLRGVPFDSSVGGKTAINTSAGKNLIGSFYQPKLVLADIGTLTSLPKRQMLSGYAEIIKYGLIMDVPFYQWCLSHGAQVVAGAAVPVQKAVMHSCRLKAEIVARDETEADARAWLNFGHTFGHALEAETGYSEKLLHGEAVAIGMVMACRLSARMGLVDAALEQELSAHFRALGLPATPKDIAHAGDAAAIASHFAQDKKAEGGELTFIVLDKLGVAQVAKNIDPAQALAVVESFLN